MTAPSEPAGGATFATIGGKPIVWRGRGATHQVVGADVHPGIRLLWTRCEIDVPANSAWLLTSNVTAPDCTECAARAALAAAQGSQGG